jgi:hypothetical protein
VTKSSRKAKKDIDKVISFVFNGHIGEKLFCYYAGFADQRVKALRVFDKAKTAG